MGRAKAIGTAGRFPPNPGGHCDLSTARTAMSAKALVTLASVLLTAGAALAQTRALATTSVAPNYDGYLRIDGVQGNSQTAGYAGWFDVKEWVIGTNSVPTAATRHPGLSTLLVRGQFVTALPQLWVNANVGAPLTPSNSLRLDVVAPGDPNPVLVHTITMNRVRLLQILSNVADATELTLEFEAIDSVVWTWKKTPADVVYTWTRTALGSDNFRLPSLTYPVADGAHYTALMQVPGVNGGSTKANYVGWIPVSNFGADVLRALPVAGMQVTPSLTEIKCSVFPGQALPELIRNVAVGTRHAEIKLHLFKNATDTTPFLELRLLNCVVSGVIDYGGSNGGACPTSFEPMSMEWTYIDSTGRRTRGCWDFANRRAC